MQAVLLVMIPAVLASAVLVPAQQKPTTVAKENTMEIKKMTPNLYTDDVEACVRFWVDRLHFEKTMEVPDGGALAFAALQKGSIELMYGSYASLKKDAAVAQSYRRGTAFLFLEVDDVDAVFAVMNGAPIITAMHKTFYGSTEFTVQDPAGNMITFAQFGKP
jgi:uncharacterized glyoxalase superfamily protein PhnB